ncbi:ATP-binding protein [Megalodesulfovibrio paquesii]
MERPVVRLSLRQKFLASIASYVISISVVGYLSYTDLATLQRHLSTVEEMQLVSNDLLESRRFEKNFLLYHNPEELRESLAFVGKAEALAQTLADSGLAVTQRALLGTLRASITGYKNALAHLTDAPDGLNEEQLELTRLHGKQMVDGSERLLANETARIRATINELLLQLAVAVAASLLLGIFAAWLMFGKLFNALHIINSATRRIARGVFEPLPEVGPQREAQRIVQALNAMVKELEIRQDQLLQAKKLSSIGTLAAGIAHQLNNPLNNISTSSQIALEELEETARQSDPANPLPLSGEALDFLRKMLTNIDSESFRAKEIVQGLLEFSRERSFACSTVRLKQVVDKTIRLVSSQVPGSIVIQSDIPEHLTLELDVQRMQEALLNLIINAVHAIEPGNGRIALQAQEEDGQVLIRVQDSGRGIPPEVRDKVFDPFFTTRGESGGTGLGLSIVYGIIERHKGKITVESTPGTGTTFTIRLPATPICTTPQEPA